MNEVLDNIPFKLDPDQIAKSLRLRKANSQVEEIAKDLVRTATPLARPKAVYKISYVDKKNGDSLEIDGVKFTSRVLRINLDKLNRVFPYVATCGRDLDTIEIPAGDLMRSFILETIKISVLSAAVRYLSDYVKKKYALEEIARMNPGSLEDWPINQQTPLFSLFGDVEKLIGVRLTASNLMQPLKSASGIYFATEVTFENCQLCPRERCPGRRMPYDRELVKKYEQMPKR